MTKAIGPLELDEVKVVRFDFSTEVLNEAALHTPEVVCTVLKGTDADPQSVLVGSASVLEKEVLQLVKPGVAGVTYHLRATVQDDYGQTHGMTAHMRVVGV